MSHKSLIHQREEQKLQPFLCSSIGSPISQKNIIDQLSRNKKKESKKKKKSFTFLVFFILFMNLKKNLHPQ